MKSLVRRQFVDQLWDAANLDEVAEFWLRLYETAARSRAYSRTLTQRLEIRLSGFAKPDGPALCKELERRVQASDVAEAKVSLADPDTLVLSSAKKAGDVSPSSGLGLAFLGGPPFQGLVAEIRFRVSGRERPGGRLGGVLVIIGELCDSGILVKAVWRSSLTGWEGATPRLALPREEKLLLNGLTEFRTSEEVTPGLAKKVFRLVGGDWIAKWIVTSVVVPFGRDRFPGLLLRVAGFTFGTVASCWLIDLLIENKFWAGLVLLGLLLFIPATLLGFFVLLEGVYLVGGYRSTQRTFVSYYEEDGFVPLSAQEAATRLADPLSRKYLAELSAAGFVLIGGVGVLSRGECGSVHRVFAAPDGVTYLILICISYVKDKECRMHFWPQVVALKSYVFVTEGARIESASALNYGFWKQRVGPNTLICFVRDVEDPIEFSRNHAAAAAAFAKERGLTPARHERFEDFVRRWEVIHEEQRQQYLDRGFTWSDHLRWYLQWPRKEFRG